MGCLKLTYRNEKSPLQISKDEKTVPQNWQVWVGKKGEKQHKWVRVDQNGGNDPNSDLVGIARALSNAKGGEKWDDVIDPSVWARYLRKKSDMGGGFRWAGKIGGIKVDGYSGSRVEFSQVRFYSPARQRQWYLKMTSENLTQENFPLDNPISGKEFEYPYKIRVSGYFDQRPSQVMTFGFSSWKSFTVFSEIIMGIR